MVSSYSYGFPTFISGADIGEHGGTPVVVKAVPVQLSALLIRGSGVGLVRAPLTVR